jgi:uncharacterized repeat protein (TIGR03803 family)
VFAINADGTGFTNLHSFAAGNNNSSGNFANADGANPYGGLILSGNILYGTAYDGRTNGFGTVYAINADGTGFTNLYDFTGGYDGANPYNDLTISGNTLYGTAIDGGTSGDGTVFAIKTDGTGFTNLYAFTGGNDGSGPNAVTFSHNNLYGTAFYGGNDGNGTMFSISFAPQLTIIPSGADVILTWPTNIAGFDFTGFTLQATTNLDSPANWSTNSPGPVVVNGQNTVTNSISGTQMFFRLIQ